MTNAATRPDDEAPATGYFEVGMTEGTRPQQEIYHTIQITIHRISDPADLSQYSGVL
jgi:hypothetical protein